MAHDEEEIDMNRLGPVPTGKELDEREKALRIHLSDPNSVAQANLK